MIRKINVQDDPILKEVMEYARAATSYSNSGALLEMLKRSLKTDILGLGGRWSAKASERRAARRAERKAAEAASPAKPQEPQADDDGERVWRTGEEWTSSDDYKAVSAAVKAVWDKADMEGRERINRMWSDVREDEQAACDFLRGLQKAG